MERLNTRQHILEGGKVRLARTIWVTAAALMINGAIVHPCWSQGVGGQSPRVNQVDQGPPGALQGGGQFGGQFSGQTAPGRVAGAASAGQAAGPGGVAAVGQGPA